MDGFILKDSKQKTAPIIELHLISDTFAAGKQLNGVVVFRAAKITSIRSLTVHISGIEAPAGASLARSLRRTTMFFQRELVLSGVSQFRSTSEHMAHYWNALLGRYSGKTICQGNHIYPFTFQLPASLPPSYEGKAGKIAYTVAVKTRFPLGRSTRLHREVRIVSIPRSQRERPVALTYPNTNGTLQESKINVNLELADESVALGSVLKGKYTISNPQKTEIDEVVISLETCEWVKLMSEKEMSRNVVQVKSFPLKNTAEQIITNDFTLNVPKDAPPSVEGTAISVIWLLKVNLLSSPPLELKTPILVFAPLEDNNIQQEEISNQ